MSFTLDGAAVGNPAKEVLIVCQAAGGPQKHAVLPPQDSMPNHALCSLFVLS